MPNLVRIRLTPFLTRLWPFSLVVGSCLPELLSKRMQFATCAQGPGDGQFEVAFTWLEERPRKRPTEKGQSRVNTDTSASERWRTSVNAKRVLGLESAASTEASVHPRTARRNPVFRLHERPREWVEGGDRGDQSSDTSPFFPHSPDQYVRGETWKPSLSHIEPDMYVARIVRPTSSRWLSLIVLCPGRSSTIVVDSTIVKRRPPVDPARPRLLHSEPGLGRERLLDRRWRRHAPCRPPRRPAWT